MIAKRIMTPQGGSGYHRLAGYVLNVRPEHQPADPAAWTRLNAYILDTDHQGEKVAWTRVTNCQSEDPGWAVKEILATQGLNTRGRADKSYHLVVSFPEGEKPTRQQMENIEDRLCAALGFEEHQRVSAVHQNTDNWHLHVAINKVHPGTFRTITPFRDHYRLQEACAELEIRHGLIREPHTTEPEPRVAGRRDHGRAAECAAGRDGPAFAQWIRENAAPALLAARESGQGWAELHRVAGRHGLEIRPRGAGLVIAHCQQRRLRVKASDVDRRLSLPALTAALGPYEPPDLTPAQQPERSYLRPEPSGALYDAYKQARATALAAREAALKSQRAEQAAYAARLAAYYRERLRREALSGLRGHLRRDAFRHITGMRRKDRIERAQREREERRRVRAAHPLPTWQSYLEQEAANGNEAALAALRGRQQRQTRLETQLLTAPNSQEARHLVYRHLRPAIRRDGRVIYRLTDGGLVSDEAQRVRVTEVTAAAALLAVSLAADRFGSRPLLVQGTESFRKQIAVAAATGDLAIRFADRDLDQLRMATRSARTHESDSPQRSDPGIYNKRDTSNDRDRGR